MKVSADHGLVHVAESSSVNSYRSVFGPASVKRSISFVPAVPPRKLVPGAVKFVVSTTSVLPSQRPRESPSQFRTLDGRCGRPSRGMMRASLFDCMISTAYPGARKIYASAVTPAAPAAESDPGLPPRVIGPALFPVIQRVYPFASV